MASPASKAAVQFGNYIEPSVIDRRPDTVPLPVAKAPPLAELKSVALQQVSKVGRPGLEPGTYGVKVRSSTIELATPRLDGA